MAFGGSIKKFILFVVLLCFVAESQQMFLDPNATQSALSEEIYLESDSLSITNGSNSTAGQFPYFVTVVLYDLLNGADWTCAGALIKRDIVITPASCLTECASSAEAYLGLIDSATPPSVHKVSQFAYHPKYNEATGVYNIAIYQLAEAVKSSTNIKPIAMATKPLPCGAKPTMMGFGEINDGGDLPQYLQYATFSVMTYSSCTKYYMFDVGQYFCIQSPDYYPVSRGCKYDQGDPVVLNNKLYGLMFYISDSACEEDYPNLVVSIDYVAPWIKEMIKKAPKGW